MGLAFVVGPRADVETVSHQPFEFSLDHRQRKLEKDESGLMPSTRGWTFGLWGVAAFFWFSWHLHQPPVMVALGLTSLALMVPLFLRARADEGFLILAALVPFEYSVTRGVFPSFSPIDLVCLPLS